MTIDKAHFRYDTSGNWYKGNTHMHSQTSDGGKTLEELATLYAGGGYDFISCTDHWAQAYDLTSDINYPLLLIEGIELDGRDPMGGYYHVVCLGATQGIQREMGLSAALQTAREQHAMTILAHPHWCGNTFDEALRWDFDGVEVYNHVCHWLNGKSSGAVHWNAMLKVNPNTLAFAVDDAHLRPTHPTWNGGWIMVNSPELTQPAVLDAIRSGNFYASCGPSFTALEFDGESIHITCSPVRFIRLVGPDSRGQRTGVLNGQLLTSASLVIPQDWDYVYVEIEDDNGRLAWSNTLFV
jgi:hypothetical protein